MRILWKVNIGVGTIQQSGILMQSSSCQRTKKYIRKFRVVDSLPHLKGVLRGHGAIKYN